MEGGAKREYARWLDVGLVTAALIAGLALARGAVLPAAMVLLGSAAIVAILIEPLIGLGLALMAAPLSALERFTWGLPLDSGQVLLMLTLGAWLLRGLARREIYLPSPTPTPANLGRRLAIAPGEPFGKLKAGRPPTRTGASTQSLSRAQRGRDARLKAPQVQLESLKFAPMGAGACSDALRASRRGEGRPHAPLTIPLLIFTGVAAFSLWSASSVSAGLKELLKWLEVIAVYWFVITTVDRKRLPWLIGMVLMGALVQAGLGVWQFALRGSGPEHFWITGPLYRAYGTFHQPNPLGGYIGLTLPLALGLLISNFKFTQHASPLRVTPDPIPHTQYPIRLLLFALGASCLLLLAGLVASWSRGAWLGAVAAIAAMAAFWPRRWWLGVSVVLVIAALVLGGSALGVLPSVLQMRLADLTQYVQVYDVRGIGVNDANYAVIERLAHWQAAYEMIRWHLWSGVGLGHYEVVYDTYRLLNWPYPLGHAHNYILNITAETGMPGLLAYVFLWGAIFWQTFGALGKTSGWQRGLVLGLGGVWVHLHIHNMFDNLYVSNLWIHLAVLLGMIRTNDE